MLVRNCCDFSDVDERQCGVRGRLDPDELGIGSNEVGNVNLNAGAECDLDIMRESYFGEVAMCSSIYV
jgi:hypothetical protein